MLKQKTKKGKYNKEYALYNGDEFVAVGTIKEISEMTGIKYSTIRMMKSCTKKNMEQNKGFMLIEVESE